MIQRQFTIIDEAGFHARPASLLTNLASKYSGTVDLEYNNKKNTAKSIMYIMSLGIAQGQSFTIYVDGPEEEKLLEEIEQLFEEHNLI